MTEDVTFESAQTQTMVNAKCTVEYFGGANTINDPKALQAKLEELSDRPREDGSSPTEFMRGRQNKLVKMTSYAEVYEAKTPELPLLKKVIDAIDEWLDQHK